jgi:2'-5' RNA ligase
MWYRKAIAKKRHTSVMVAFYLPAKAAKQLGIKPKDAVEGLEPHAFEELHLTVAMLGEASELKADKKLILRALENFARSQPPLTGRVSGIGLFNHTNRKGLSPVYASFDSPALTDFRESLVDALESVGVEIDRTHGYTPHITLGWFDQERTRPLIDPPGINITLPKMSVSWAGDVQHFDLEG